MNLQHEGVQFIVYLRFAMNLHREKSAIPLVCEVRNEFSDSSLCYYAWWKLQTGDMSLPDVYIYSRPVSSDLSSPLAVVWLHSHRIPCLFYGMSGGDLQWPHI